MPQTDLAWLQEWYRNQCNGDWEHQWGIKIGTLDNPGWTLSVQLRETSLENRSFEAVRIDRAEHDWVHCKVENKAFKGAGGPLNLEELLSVFRGWATGSGS